MVTRDTITIRADEAERLRALVSAAFRPGVDQQEAVSTLCRLAGALEAVLDRAQADAAPARQASIPGT